MPAQKRVFDLEQIAKDPAKHRPKPEIYSFTHFRGYHCCRPVDVQTYYRDGIRLGSIYELQAQFREIYAHLPESALDEAISNLGPSLVEPDVYFGLDERFLLQDCGHYCIYGSERIKKWVNCLPRTEGVTYQDKLKAIGTPTVLVVDIPISEIPKEDIEEIDEALDCLAEGRYTEIYQCNDTLDVAISLHRDVPASWIVSHHTPRKVIDPDDPDNPYVSE